MNNKLLKVLANPAFYQFGVKIQAGRIIPFYWNPKAALSDPEVLKIVGQEFAKVIKQIKPDIQVIAGGESGGISIAVATALELNLPWVYIRKQSKGYSTDVLVEGMYPKGAKAILLDDVIATGNSKQIFLNNSKGELNIKDIGVILNDTGGRYPDWIKENVISVYTLFSKQERDQYFYEIGFFDQDALDLENIYEADRENWHNSDENMKLFKKVKAKYEK